MLGGGADVSGAQTSRAHTNGNDDGAPPRLHVRPEAAPPCLSKEEADLAHCWGDKEALSNGSEAPSLSGGASRQPGLVPATPGAKGTPAVLPPLPTLQAQITPRRMSDSEAILSLSPTSLNSSSNFRWCIYEVCVHTCGIHGGLIKMCLRSIRAGGATLFL